MTELLAIWSEEGVLTQILIIVLLTYMVLRGFIKLPFIHLKKTKEKVNTNVHLECLHFPSLKIWVMRAIDKGAEIARIKIYETLREQMLEADDLFVDLRDALRSNYLTLYRKQIDVPITGLLGKQDIQHYESILDNIHKPLREMMLMFLKKNHFLEKSEEEFRMYIVRRTEDLHKEVTKYLDEHYDSNSFLISREVLFESNEIVKVELYKKVEEFFYRIRTISLNQQGKIDALEEDIEAFYNGG